MASLPHPPVALSRNPICSCKFTTSHDARLPPTPALRQGPGGRHHARLRRGVELERRQRSQHDGPRQPARQRAQALKVRLGDRSLQAPPRCARPSPTAHDADLSDSAAPRRPAGRQLCRRRRRPRQKRASLPVAAASAAPCDRRSFDTCLTQHRSAAPVFSPAHQLASVPSGCERLAQPCPLPYHRCRVLPSPSSV